MTFCPPSDIFLRSDILSSVVSDNSTLKLELYRSFIKAENVALDVNQGLRDMFYGLTDPTLRNH